MEDYIGVYSKLRDPQLPWEKKISIAQNAWRNEKCFIPNKQQVLLDWVCQKLLDNILYKKDKRNADIDWASSETKDLWAYLKDSLQSLSSTVKGEDSICVPLTIIPQFIQVFAKIFSDHCSSEQCRLTDEQRCVMLDIIQCAKIILSSSTLHISFLAKLDHYVMFMSYLLSSFVVVMTLNLSINHELCKEMFCLLEVSFSLYNPVQRKQTNHRKLFERTCEYLIGPLLNACYILKNIDPVQCNACKITQDRITSFVHLQLRVLSDALFRRENLSDYSLTLKAFKGNGEQEDTTEPKSKRLCTGNYTKLLFTTLKSLLISSKDAKQEALMDSLPQLYIEYLKARRESKMGSSSLEFKFFTEMCVLLGIAEGNMVVNKCDNSLLSKVLPHVYCLLDTLLAFDVYQVAEDNSNDGVLLKWFLSLTKLLLTNLQTSTDVYRCLEVLLNLNHCILEPNLNIILQHMYDNHEVMTVAGDVSHCDSFFSSVVKTYVKLRQFDRFINEMLLSIRTLKTIQHTWKGFSDPVREELVKAVQSLPFGTSTSLWKAFNAEILLTYLPSLQVLAEKAEPHHKQDKQMNQLVFGLERVVGLYSLFLLNTTLGGVTEQNRVESTQKTLSSLFHGSVCDVLGPLWDILSNMTDNKIFRESACVSILMLFHALQESKTFLIKLGCISDDLDIFWNKYISNYLKKNLKVKAKKHLKNERLKYLLVLLCIQRVRNHLLKGGSTHSEANFQDLLDYIFILCDSISSCGPFSWNKQVWTIDKANFSLAYWYCLCDQAPLLLSVCSHKQQLMFTQCLVQSLVSADVELASNPKSINGNDLSILMVSKTLLYSADTHQVPSIQDSLISSVWLCIGEVLSLCNFTTQPKKKLVNIIKTLGTGHLESDVPDGVDDRAGDKESEDMEDSEDESVSTSEDEEETDQIQQTSAKPVPKSVSPLLSLGKALNSVLDELEPAPTPSLLDSKQMKTISHGLMVLAHMPLDWLTEVNHLSSVVGLIACDALMHSYPQQGESMEYRKVLFLVRRLLTILLNACIYKKRLVIHRIISMDSFLSWMLSSYLKSFQMETKDSLNQLQVTSIQLFCTLLKYNLKTALASSPVFGFISKFTDGMAGLTEELKDVPYSSVTEILEKKGHLLRIFGRVLAILEKVIVHKTTRLKEAKMAGKIAVNMVPSFLHLLNAIASKHSVKDVNILKPILQDLPVLIESFTAILNIYCVSQNTTRKLSQTKEAFQHWQWRPILPSILTFAVNSLQNLKDNRHSLCEKLPTSCLQFLDFICRSVKTLELDLPQDFYCSLLASLMRFLNQLHGRKEDDSHELKEKVLQSILSLLIGSPLDTLVVLLKGLSNELTCKVLTQNSVHRVSTCIHVWSVILAGRFPKLKKKQVCPILPQVLIGLQSILHMSTTNINLSVLIIGVITKLLSLGKSFIQSHYCTMALHSSLLLPPGNTNEKFPVLFQAQYGLLSSILFYQSEAVYDAMHVFVTCVKNMLRSLSQYCEHNSAKGEQDRNQLEVELVCAQKLARLYQEIETHKTTVSKYAPYMITDYIQQIQEVTLPSHVKQALVPGVYCLLDMCGEHEMAQLHVVLDKGSRELFNSLNDDYNKFHKYKGKI